MMKKLLVAALALALASAPVLAALKTTIQSNIAADYTGANDLGTPEFNLRKDTFQPDINLATGTAANQADRMFADTRTLAASATETLDLAGTLTDPLGATLTCAKVKAIQVRAASGNTNNVVVGGSASNAFTGPFGAVNDVVSVLPNGALQFVAPGAGWTVTAGTGDLLQVANSGAGTSVTYSIVIVCTSA